MPSAHVPTANINALYQNTTAGVTANPAVVDAAVADIVSTINQNADYVNSLVTSGTLSPIPPDFLYRQAIINGNFDVWQRGTSFPNPSSGQYTADRFVVIYQNSGVLPNIDHARTISPLGYVPGSTSGYWVHADGEITGQGADDYYILQQRIERGTRLLAGNKITVSFWAKSTTPGKRIGVYASQNYGTGGTPSSTEVLSGGVITLSTGWQRYSVTINTSPISGKTFGTNNDDHISVSFVYAWGSSFGGPRFGASSAEGFGGDVHIDIAQVQVNVGDIALPFQPRSFAEELALCQRYYEKSYNIDTPPGTATDIGCIQGITEDGTNNGAHYDTVYFKVRKRAVPTVIIYGTGGTSNTVNDETADRSIGSGLFAIPSETGFRMNYTLQNATSGRRLFHYVADAEL